MLFRSVLTPVLDNIEKNKLTLDLNAFSKLLSDHYKTLTVYDKDAIFGFNRKFRGIEEVEHQSYKVFLKINIA